MTYNAMLLCSCCFQIRGKAMGDKSGDMFELMRDILLTARLDDKARFTQMVAETKAGLESGEGTGGVTLLVLVCSEVLVHLAMG